MSPAARRHEPSLRWSWRLGSVFGIDVYLHATFLLLIAWLVFGYLAEGRDLARAASGLLLVASLFTIVVLHELGHALAARRFGIATRDITLLPIGGLARLERMPERPRQELLVALAGPAVNVVLAVLLFAAILLVSQAVTPERLRLVGGSFLGKLLWINVSLALFNLIPAFPMDGGRVLRALLAMRMDRARATRLAARVGRAIAVAFAVASLFWNPMLAIIAVFVWLSGQQESAAVTLRATLRGVPSERVMVTRFTSLSPAESLSSAAERVIAGSQHDFPVVEDGRVVGVLTRGDLLRGLAAEGAPLTVGQAMSRGFTVADSADTLDGILDHAPRSGEGPIVVVRDDRLLGMITPESLEDFVALETARRHGVR